MRRLVFRAVLLCVVASYALADQVSLKNGDHLSGTIVKSDGKTLVLHTDYAGDITVKWEAVQGIQSGQELHVELQDGKIAVGPVTSSDDKLQIATKASGTVEAPTATVKSLRNDAEQAAYEESLHPGLLHAWNVGINTGFALTGALASADNLPRSTDCA